MGHIGTKTTQILAYSDDVGKKASLNEAVINVDSGTKERDN